MKRFGCPVECAPEAVGKRKENSRGKGRWEMRRAAVRSGQVRSGQTIVDVCRW